MAKKPAKKRANAKGRPLQPQQMWAAVIGDTIGHTAVLFVDGGNAVSYSANDVERWISDPRFAQFNPKRVRVEVKEIRP
jgi:hypothetical protein